MTSINENGAIESKPTISSPKAQPKSLQAKPAPVIANGVGIGNQEKKENVENKIEKEKVEAEKHEKDSSEKSVKVVVESEVKSEVRSDTSEVCLANGRIEKLLGEQPDHRIRATAIVENNKLGPGEKG